MLARLLIVAALLCLPGATATGTPALPSPPVALVITGAHAAGHPFGAHLTCSASSARATGYLRQRAIPACAQARRLAAFLSTRPPSGRVCTQVYGGPQTAWLRGSIGSRSVSRRFSRRDGCEIADWSRAGGLLPSLATASPRA